jgi:membrane associated rhomboid family serine protease
MLVVPYQTRFTAKSLPVVTLVLILLNTIVFFALQERDDRDYRAAAEMYAASDLPGIELPRYQQWLVERADSASIARLKRLRLIPSQAGVGPALALMQSDEAFMRELQAERIVRRADPVYANWRASRDRFERLIERIFTERFALKPLFAEPWRFVTHQFLHGSVGHWFGNMLVLLLAGPFAEAALGRLRFLLGYLAGGAFAGAVFLLFSSSTLIGASGAIAAAMAMVAILYWTRRVPVFYWVFFYFDTARVPALALLPVWIANELYQWVSQPDARVAYSAHLGGLIGGALLAWWLRPRDQRHVDRVLDEAYGDERRAERRSGLVEQAQAAAARLDTRRAAQLYRQLVELHPDQLEYHTAYFNVSLLGHDNEQLADAALRLLWLRTRDTGAELRKAYLQMAQPKVLQALPVDEQLRLSRRLVRVREHAAALQVADRLLVDDNLRTLYGRQIADCLLGLFTTYTRFGMRQQADAVRARLSQYFPSPGDIGGLPPKAEPPSGIRTTTRGPSTLNIDLTR